MEPIIEKKTFYDAYDSVIRLLCYYHLIILDNSCTEILSYYFR